MGLIDNRVGNAAKDKAHICVQEQDFDVAHEYQRLCQDTEQDGAVVFFVGKVRDFNQGKQISALTLEHYSAMTRKTLNEIVSQAMSRWTLGKVSIVHRIGKLSLGEQIVFVGVTSAHRKSAYEASEFIMDYLKTEAPFWKKETTPSGERWVDANHKDQQAKQRWNYKNV